MPRTEEEYRQQVAEDAGPQPDEMVRLQMVLDATEEEVARLQMVRDAAERENERLREQLKTAWRFWASIYSSVPPVQDRGYTLVRVHSGRLTEFDAIFRPSVVGVDPAAPGTDRSVRTGFCRCGVRAFYGVVNPIPYCPRCEYQPCETCDCAPVVAQEG